MSDNEIIKVLECCIKHDCGHCPATAMVCGETVAMEYAFDLINRQKAEIERLSKTLEKSIVAPMPMAEWLRQELTDHVYKRCMEEL